MQESPLGLMKAVKAIFSSDYEFPCAKLVSDHPSGWNIYTQKDVKSDSSFVYTAHTQMIVPFLENEILSLKSESFTTWLL